MSGFGQYYGSILSMLDGWRVDLGLNVLLGMTQVLLHCIGLYLLYTIKRKQVVSTINIFAYVNTLLIAYLSLSTVFVGVGNTYAMSVHNSSISVYIVMLTCGISNNNMLIYYMITANRLLTTLYPMKCRRMVTRCRFNRTIFFASFLSIIAHTLVNVKTPSMHLYIIYTVYTLYSIFCIFAYVSIFRQVQISRRLTSQHLSGKLNITMR